MKYWFAIFVFIVSLLLDSCDTTDPVNPNKNIILCGNQLTKLILESSTDARFITLNFSLTNETGEIVYPQSDTNGICLKISVTDLNNFMNDTLLCYDYDLDSFASLFGTQELKPGLVYSAKKIIDSKDFLPIIPPSSGLVRTHFCFRSASDSIGIDVHLFCSINFTFQNP